MIRWPAGKRPSPKLARVQRALSVTELSPGEFVARLDQMITVYAVIPMELAIANPRCW